MRPIDGMKKWGTYSMSKTSKDPVILRRALNIAIKALKWYASATQESRAKGALEEIEVVLEGNKTTKKEES